MRMTVILSLFMTGALAAACAEPSPWADWESAPKTNGGAIASDQTGYKDYTPRPAIESAPLGSAANQNVAAQPVDSPYASAGAMDGAASTGAPTPLHAGPFAVDTNTPIAYSGTPVVQRTLPLALTGTGVAR